jgi:6-phosphogluconolactonase (cycloisomerase 2 family)
VLVTAEAGSGEMHSFIVAPDGTLAPVPGSPYSGYDIPASVAFSPNGSLLAMTTDGGTVYTFQVGGAGGLSEVDHLNPKGTDGKSLELGGVAFNHDGDLLAVTNYIWPGDAPGNVLIIGVDPHTGMLKRNVIAQAPAGIGPISAGFGPAESYGQLLAVAAQDNYGEGSQVPGTVTMFKVAPSGALSQVGWPANTAISTDSVAFSPPGALLATANQGGSVSMFRVDETTGGLTALPPAPADAPTSVAFSPNGALLATGNAGDNTVSVFAVGPDGSLAPVTGSPFTALTNSPPPPHASASVAFGRDGGVLASTFWNTDDSTTGQKPGWVAMFRVGPPTATIQSPPGGGIYSPGEAVATSFACGDAAYAPGVASCVDSKGQAGPTGALETATLGPHTYAVTSTSSDGQTAEGSISYTVVGPPSATIASPAPGGVYLRGQPVATAFSCSDATGAPGIASCLDSNRQSAAYGALDTSQLGAHTYMATATSRDGQSGLATISYTVVDPPTATISVPATGGTYTLGEAVPTAFSCADASSAPGIASCVDSSGHEAPRGKLDASALGPHVYAVTATSRDGGTGAARIAYLVTPPRPKAVLRAVRSVGPTVSVTIACQGDPGLGCAGSVSVRSGRGTSGRSVPRRRRMERGAAASRGHSRGGSVAIRTWIDDSRVLASGSYSAPAGHEATITLNLDPWGARLLRRLWKVAGTLEINGTTPVAHNVVFRYPRIRSRYFDSYRFYSGDRTLLGGPVVGLPPGARLRITCHGPGCAFRMWVKTARARKVDVTPVLAGSLLAVGATVELEITAPNRVGKVRILTMRAGRKPAIKRRCLTPGASKPVPCGHRG